MTQPAPPAQQQQQPTAAQQQQAVLVAAEVLAAATTVAGAAGLLIPVFAALGIRAAAVHAALSVLLEHPPDREGFYGPATGTTARLNLIRRAQFLVNSAVRLSADLSRVASGEQPATSLLDAIARERRYYGQHMMATWNRMRAAAAVDTAVMDYGPLLGWYAVMDAATSPECRRANRHNFRADVMPRIGYPGAVHPHCRCLPGPPIPGAPLLGPPSLVRAPRRARQPVFA